MSRRRKISPSLLSFSPYRNSALRSLVQGFSEIRHGGEPCGDVFCRDRRQAAIGILQQYSGLGYHLVPGPALLFVRAADELAVGARQPQFFIHEIKYLQNRSSYERHGRPPERMTPGYTNWVSGAPAGRLAGRRCVRRPDTRSRRSFPDGWRREFHRIPPRRQKDLGSGDWQGR